MQSLRPDIICVMNTVDSVLSEGLMSSIKYWDYLGDSSDLKLLIRGAIICVHWDHNNALGP